MRINYLAISIIFLLGIGLINLFLNYEIYMEAAGPRPGTAQKAIGAPQPEKQSRGGFYAATEEGVLGGLYFVDAENFSTLYIKINEPASGSACDVLAECQRDALNPALYNCYQSGGIDILNFPGENMIAVEFRPEQGAYTNPYCGIKIGVDGTYKKTAAK